ncbi:MATE family efflux transporter [Pseudodesulfovibrio tunisiensis]|uniref:MATE family efflux transporter n=1 Tax=Pseudodesulfovibrio tunisiensis TaxID=463192 RepID=UPI001FB2B56B|nr:MATE family efflux transporter [Pseudodesulfovibrio tunisiensis]
MSDSHAHGEHPFVSSPNRTLAGLAVPVLFSLVAEPLTGLADTAFVARLPGSEPVAALGIGTVAFSSIFWAFTFLGIGTQTEVAHSLGRNDRGRAVRVASLASVLAAAIGVILMIVALPLLDWFSLLLGAKGVVVDHAGEYMRYRLLGAPGVLVSLACFGALRGMEDMRTPLWVAVSMNVLNILLDWALVFGVGPFPAMGVAGAAVASSISQWFGAVWAFLAVTVRLGFLLAPNRTEVGKLFSIGGDLFVRTGMVLLFLALCTRAANAAGAHEGAAYQAIRQFFIFGSLFLDAFAITGQTLVGYFLGRRNWAQARRVAAYVCWWSVGMGGLLCVFMLFFRQGIATLLVPPSAVHVFFPAWTVAALLQPIGALSYATDGIHWGTGDFRYLRNAMIVASLVGGGVVFGLEQVGPDNVLVYIWLATILWAGIRAAFGLVRVWPGIGRAPLGRGGVR